MRKFNIALTYLMTAYVGFRTWTIIQGYSDLSWTYVLLVFALGIGVAGTFASLMGQGGKGASNED